MFPIAVENHLGLVANLAREVSYSRRLPLDDLIQEGCLGLLYAARSFNPAKGCKFTTFAARAVRWFLRKALNKVRPWQTLSSCTEEHISAPAEPEPGVREEVERLLQCTLPEERRVIDMCFGLGGLPEMPTRQIADRLGVSRQRVEFLLKRGLKRMRSLVR